MSGWHKFCISQIPPLPPKPVTTVSAAEAKSKKQLGQLSGENTWDQNFGILQNNSLHWLVISMPSFILNSTVTYNLILTVSGM